MNEITIESFEEALKELIEANAHARNKGDKIKDWIKDNFNCEACTAFIKAQQQLTNRVSEQFRYFAPIVIFVCLEDVNRDRLIDYILERSYDQLEAVAIVGAKKIEDESSVALTSEVADSNASDDDDEVLEGNYEYEYEHLIVFKDSKFETWATPNFENTRNEKKVAWFIDAIEKDNEGIVTDYSTEFIKNGYWICKDLDALPILAEKVKKGYRVVLKTTFTQDEELPFDNKGKKVVAMNIIATGRIKENRLLEEQKIEIDWEETGLAKVWYGPGTIKNKIDVIVGNHEGLAKLLFLYVFKNVPQDYWICEEYCELANEEETIDNTVLKYDTNVKTEFGRNRIIFGAPGTGKSFTLNDEKDSIIRMGGLFERVTFHPDYSYANFVGTYKPIMVDVPHSSKLEEDKKEVLSILLDTSKSAQEKYDLLYDTFKDDGLTRLPILLGLYSDDSFKTKKQDGTDAVGDNSVERNHGKAIRPYVELIDSCSGKKEIAYKYVPGPFMRVLVKALKSAMTGSPKPYLLLIEEINRANVAAVFGDVFQLLDRNKKGFSEYEIATSNDMRSYLAEELDVDESMVETIRIPNNMFIWATMNSADQGVFPMDTAFKRRWDFTYLGIDDAEEDMSEEIKLRTFTFGKGDYARLVTWNDIRSSINDELSSDTYNINEDKLLGPYFISKEVLEGPEKTFMKVFKDKLLMYLFDDAVKQKKKTFFEKCKDEKKGVRYSEICDAFDDKGIFIFPDSISSKFSVVPTEKNGVSE